MNNKEPEKQQKIKNVINIRWTLLIFDLIVFAFCAVALYFLSDRGPFPIWTVAISACFVFLFRFIFRIYSQIWRYGGVQSGDDEEARHALMTAVPTYKKPEEVNSKYEEVKQ